MSTAPQTSVLQYQKTSMCCGKLAAWPLHEHSVPAGSLSSRAERRSLLRLQVDTMLQREAAAQLPGNWCTFAQNCVMQLRDLEDAMQVLLP